jgi:hypothetical protein
MVLTEPILTLLSLSMAFLSGIIYLDFMAYPIIYRETREWPIQTASLPLLGTGVGMALPVIRSFYLERLYAWSVEKMGSVPEARLTPLVVTAWLAPVGLF